MDFANYLKLLGFMTLCVSNWVQWTTRASFRLHMWDSFKIGWNLKVYRLRSKIVLFKIIVAFTMAQLCLVSNNVWVILVTVNDCLIQCRRQGKEQSFGKKFLLSYQFIWTLIFLKQVLLWAFVFFKWSNVMLW